MLPQNENKQNILYLGLKPCFLMIYHKLFGGVKLTGKSD